MSAFRLVSFPFPAVGRASGVAVSKGRGERRDRPLVALPVAQPLGLGLASVGPRNNHPEHPHPNPCCLHLSLSDYTGRSSFRSSRTLHAGLLWYSRLKSRLHQSSIKQPQTPLNASCLGRGIDRNAGLLLPLRFIILCVVAARHFCCPLSRYTYTYFDHPPIKPLDNYLTSWVRKKNKTKNKTTTTHTQKLIDARTPASRQSLRLA